MKKSAEEQHGTVVKVFDSGAKGLQFPVEPKKFSIAARSNSAAVSWGSQFQSG